MSGTRRRARFVLVFVVVVVLVGCVLAWYASGARALLLAWQDCRRSSQGLACYVGRVRDGRLDPLTWPRSPRGAVRFTRIPMQAAQSPESGELDLRNYEGRWLVVQGHPSGGWVYAAHVVSGPAPLRRGD